MEINQQTLGPVLQRMGFDSLTPMQLKAAEADTRRLQLIAPTGTGKTFAFTVAAMRNMAAPGSGVSVIVIAPSRELVIQVAEVMRRAFGPEYKTVAFYGGHSMTDEKNALSPVPDIIVATPGRLLDHFKRGQLDAPGFKTLVIDEYDKCLELGFEGEMRRICSRLPLKNAAIVLTSATRIAEIPPYLPMKDSVIIDMAGEGSPRSRMEVVEVPSFDRDKLATLTSLLGSIEKGARSIIFVNHRESAERVWNHLRTLGVAAGLYHGGLDQDQRATAVDLFTNGTTPALVATDLAARGLDVEQVENVIHYHLPVDEQAWTHRNGRTARVDARGTVYVIVTEEENIPEYIDFDRQYIPDPDARPKAGSAVATLYVAAGKKEKISRGDIVGFLIKNAQLESAEIGRIALRDHSALVAVPAEKAAMILKAVEPCKLKGKKIKISRVKA